MAQYKITSSGVHDTESGGYIPVAVGNRHWLIYKEWKAVPNTPDPSMDEVTWIANERQSIKQTFDMNVRAGFVTTVTSFKFNSVPDDIQKLQMAHDLAIATSAANVDVRDFDNVIRNVTTAQLQTIITDLNMNYKTLLNQKWADQGAVTGGANYTNFVSAELAAHNVLVAAN